MLSTLIFDLDGTLLNTLDDLHKSVCHALKEAGLHTTDKKDTRRYLGNGIKNLIFKSVEQVKPDADETVKTQVLNLFRTYYVAHSLDETAPYEGIHDLLVQCQKKGFYTAIVSNKLDKAVKDLYKAFFINYIDFALGETTHVKRKPAPDMVDEAIRQLSLIHKTNIKKEECLYIGDSEVDLKTAENAGLRCLAVSWGFRDKDWLEECGAKYIANQPEEVLAWIMKISDDSVMIQ